MSRSDKRAASGPSAAPEAKQTALPPPVPGPPQTAVVKITAFKVYTSAGRHLAGDVHTLPADEAAALVESGQAVIHG